MIKFLSVEGNVSDKYKASATKNVYRDRPAAQNRQKIIGKILAETFYDEYFCKVDKNKFGFYNFKIGKDTEGQPVNIECSNGISGEIKQGKPGRYSAGLIFHRYLKFNQFAGELV